MIEAHEIRRLQEIADGGHLSSLSDRHLLRYIADLLTTTFDPVIGTRPFCFTCGQPKLSVDDPVCTAQGHDLRLGWKRMCSPEMT